MMGLRVMPARGQIVSYLDDSGRRIFINADPKPIRRSSLSTAPKSASAATPDARLPAPQSSGHPSPLAQAAQSMPPTSNPNETIIQSTPAEIARMVREVSSRYNVDPELIEAVIQTESHGNPSAVSRKGALGLMQLVPETAQQMGVKNAFDPKQNLDGGVRYLQMLLQRYNGDLDRALAAYNAGPRAVDRAGGVPRYGETRAYVRKVTNSYYRPGSERLSGLFASQHRIYREVDSDGRVVFTNE
jgi:soluble lytic murein transglycosylase-like protein